MTQIHVVKDVFLTMLSLDKIIQRRRWWMGVELWWSEVDRGRKPNTRIKTCPSATLQP
jgi:hypothetical protein